MTCNSCNIWRKPFQTQEQFTQFKKKLVELVDNGILMKIDIEANSSPFHEVFYKCLNCGQKWRLSFPDQAYRGGWFEQ